MFFFFNDTATTEIYTLSLHDALPISAWLVRTSVAMRSNAVITDSNSRGAPGENAGGGDRKSTRLNSSHLVCRLLLEKKNKTRFISDKARSSALMCSRS